VETANVHIVYMDLTASQLTKWAKEKLTEQGCRVNRVNNIPVRRRKGTIEKGWADLQGYTNIGIYICCEVKKIGDKLSPEQMNRLEDVVNCGGIAYICSEQDNEPLFIQWGETKF
jgi:hypothetical protein